MNSSVLVLGGSLGGIQAALDLADAGIQVELIESAAFLAAGRSPSLPPHLVKTRLLEVLRHPNIKVHTKARLQNLQAENGGFEARLLIQPRYVDLDRCTACGKCTEVCPVTAPGTDHKAIYLNGQPGCMDIAKDGKAPCAAACPAGIHVQGYVTLIAHGRFQEAIDLIREAMPFPSVCGRVCNHQCEANCTRGKVDGAVNIMALKRFASDWEYAHPKQSGQRRPAPAPAAPTGKRVAIIGSGPAGLTAARDLVRQGHAVTVFEALPIAGGMMRVGIPPHRLPADLLDWEIQQIVDEGVEIRLNAWVDDIPGLLSDDGYDAVLIATGAHQAKKLPIRNSNHRDNWLSLDLLRRVCLGEKVDLRGKRIVILGGGNVALDTARTVLRLGAAEVRMACLEPRGEMPGFDWEIGVAEEEGIQICPARTFKEIVVEDDKVIGVRCAEITFRGFTRGRPDFDEISNSEHILPADLVIWAIGQMPNFSFLPQDGSINTNYPVGIQSDEHMHTTMPGVFVAGDVRRGVTFFVVDAIGEGHKAARSIDCYLRGGETPLWPASMPSVTYTEKEAKDRLKLSGAARQKRVPISSLPLEERRDNFREVDLTLTEEQARREARRCLACGPCSECLACERICEADAITHNQQAAILDVHVRAVIRADDTESRWSGDGSGSIICVPSQDLLAASAGSFEALAGFRFEQQSPSPAAAALLPSGQARTGVFICQCRGEITNYVDTQAVCAQADELPGVVHAQVLETSCTPEAAKLIWDVIRQKSLDQVIVAACSCCALNQVCFSCTYQRVRCKDNLNIFSGEGPRFEFVNIREQCAWVHADDPAAATAKAERMVATAAARVGATPVRLAGPRPMERSALVLGDSPAAHLCLEALQRLGILAEQISGSPDRIQRAGGQFVITVQDGQIHRASALVLAPKGARQNSLLQAAFGRERRRPQPRPLWGNVETRRPGVFFCDPAIRPEVTAKAAAARLAAWLGHVQSRPPIAAIVDPERCRACKTCIETCEYCAPELIEINGRHTAWVDPAICTGCGTCAVHCPSGAISAGCSTDAQLQAMLGAILTPL